MQPKPVRLMDHREFPILYVDDEPDNLRIFELTFRRQFTILSAQSPEEALRLLQGNPVAVILSDYRMPGMNGVEFLAAAQRDRRPLHPHARHRLRRRPDPERRHQRRPGLPLHREALGARGHAAHAAPGHRDLRDRARAPGAARRAAAAEPALAIAVPRARPRPPGAAACWAPRTASWASTAPCWACSTATASTSPGWASRPRTRWPSGCGDADHRGVEAPRFLESLARGPGAVAEDGGHRRPGAGRPRAG